MLAASAMLRGNPLDLRAWHLLCRALVGAGDQDRGRAALADLAEAYRRAGDLPMAVVTALELGGAGGDARSILDALAGTFSNAAAGLVDDWRPAPPAIPCRATFDLILADDAEAVGRAADEALDAARAAMADRGGDDDRRRFFPLFSSLGPDAMVRFAERLRLERRHEGEVVIEQGAPGESFYVVAQGEVHVVRRQTSRDGEAGAGGRDGGAMSLLARLGPGAFFGEMAIVTAVPRAARVVAAGGGAGGAGGEVTLLRADMGEVGPEMERSAELGQVLKAFCRARMLENVVVASPVLRQVPAAERSALLERFTEVAHPAGSVIIEEGAEAKGLYLLVSGEVAISRRDQGDTLSLARLGAGDFFGEISLVLRRPAVATVTAVRAAVSLHLECEAFRDVIRVHPALLAELYETALRREEETASILAREAEAADDLILV
jgi:cAMP-dependent protein kinase regulator